MMSDDAEHARLGGPEVVYHGSTSLVETIDVARGKPYKDYGRGFYVTRDRTHARKLALRNRHIDARRFGRQAEAYLHTYEMNMSGLSEFRVKEFVYADVEWVQFVLANRKARDRTHNYDVVMGPTANDDTMVVMNAYLDGLFGDLGSEGALNTLLERIEAENLPGQIYFSTNDATRLLTPKGPVERL